MWCKLVWFRNDYFTRQEICGIDCSRLTSISNICRWAPASVTDWFTKDTTWSCRITQNEPLMSHIAPTRPWEKVGVDVLIFTNRNYLLPLIMSDFFEGNCKPSKTVTNITFCLRHHFAHHGLPAELMIDSSPFCAPKFTRYAKHVTIKFAVLGAFQRSRRKRRSHCEMANDQGSRRKQRPPLLSILEWRHHLSSWFCLLHNLFLGTGHERYCLQPTSCTIHRRRTARVQLCRTRRYGKEKNITVNQWNAGHWPWDKPYGWNTTIVHQRGVKQRSTKSCRTGLIN